MELSDVFKHRWICQVHVLPSKHEDYYSPDAIGAYVCVVADAKNEMDFVSIVRSTLEDKMLFPVIEIREIEILSPDRQIAQELQDSIDHLLPIFPIAFSSFYHYTGE
jgi:hypothetical protein